MQTFNSHVISNILVLFLLVQLNRSICWMVRSMFAISENTKIPFSKWMWKHTLFSLSNTLNFLLPCVSIFFFSIPNKREKWWAKFNLLSQLLHSLWQRMRRFIENNFDSIHLDWGMQKLEVMNIAWMLFTIDR